MSKFPEEKQVVEEKDTAAKASSKKSKVVAIVLLVFVVLFCAAVFYFVGMPLVRYISKPEKFREYVAHHGILGEVAFVGMVVLQIIVAIIPGEPFEIVAGYAFGSIKGTILCLIATAIGSMLVFFLVRVFGKKLVHIFFSEEKLKKIRFLQVKDPKKKGRRDIIFLIIYMLPGTPKDLLSYFAGLTDISVFTWFLICTLGRIPSIITSTIGGDAISRKEYWKAVIVFAVTMAISGLGILLYNKICTAREQKKTASKALSDGAEAASGEGKAEEETK